MRTRQDFRSVRIQRAIIDIQAEINHTCKHDILRCSADLRVRKEERHCDQRANNHGVFSSQGGVTHVSGEHGAPYAAEIYERVVAPSEVGKRFAEGGAAALEVGGEEDIVSVIEYQQGCSLMTGATYRGYARPINVQDSQMRDVEVPMRFVAYKPFRCVPISPRLHLLLP